MKKVLPYTLASIILLGGASTTLPTEASAAPSYKILKNKLVHSKTGKAVKGTVLYKKKLYTNGKVTTKTMVYKKQLFQKGKLASGKVVYKNTLYVSGKIKSSIVKHNNQFYKKGKKVASNYSFEYAGKLYKGSKLLAGYKTYDDALYYNGVLFTGVKDKTFYKYGSKHDDFSDSLFYSEDGTSITLKIMLYVGEKVTFNLSDIQVSNGATVKNASVSAGDDDETILAIELENTKMNENYTLQIDNLSFGKFNGISHKESFSGLTTEMKEDETYIQLKEFYDKYKDYSDAQAKKLNKNSDEYKEMDKVVGRFIDYAHNSAEFSNPENNAKYALASFLYDKFEMQPNEW